MSSRLSIGNVIRIFVNCTIHFIVIIKLSIVPGNSQIFLRNHHIWVLRRRESFPRFYFIYTNLERFNPAVIEQRRLATKKFLNYAVEHLYLRTHDAYTNFFQVMWFYYKRLPPLDSLSSSLI